MPIGGKPAPRARTPASLVQEIRKIHASVDAEDDAISRGLRQFEESLNKLLRVRVSSVISSEDVGQGTSYARVLAYTKTESGWKLVIESGYDHDEEVSATALLSASREVRTEVVTDGHLQKLLEAAVTQLKAQAAEKLTGRQALDRLNEELCSEVATSGGPDLGGDDPGFGGVP